MESQDKFSTHYNKVREECLTDVLTILNLAITNIVDMLNTQRTWSFAPVVDLDTYLLQPSKLKTQQTIYVEKEMQVSFKTYYLMNLLDDKDRYPSTNTSLIVKEIEKFCHGIVLDGRLTSIIMNLFESVTKPSEFIYEATLSRKEWLPIFFRVLFVFLVLFNESQLIEEREAQQVAKIFNDLLSGIFILILECLSCDIGNIYDPQLPMYIIKIASLLQFPVVPLTSLMGKIHSSLPLIGLIEIPLLIENNEFWLLYYEWSNRLFGSDIDSIFISSNEVKFLFPGEAQFIEVVLERSIKYSENGVALFEVAQIICSMKQGFPSVNSIIKFICEKKDISQLVGYKIVRDNEDELSIRGYLNRERSGVKKDGLPSLPKYIEEADLTSTSSAIAAINLSLDFLDIESLYELSTYVSSAFIPNCVRIAHELLITRRTPPEMRKYLYYMLISKKCRRKKILKLEFPPSQSERDCCTIQKDLDRSLQFMTPEITYDKLYNILGSVSYSEPEVGYYQGLNYVAIVFLKVFQGDELTTYRMLSFLTSEYLNPAYADDLEGLMELLFYSDSLIQKNYGLVWSKMDRGGVTSIHFAVSLFMTLYSSTIKNEHTEELTMLFLDTFLGSGFSGLLAVLLSLFEEQKEHMLKLQDEEVILALKNLETHPFNILIFADIDPTIVNLKVKRWSERGPKWELIDMEWIEQVSSMYRNVHKQVLREWGEKFRLV